MAQEPDEARTTPFGLWRYGNDFRLAAQDVLGGQHGKYFMPYYFLIGQAIELFLKAFLRARGVSVKELKKNPFGHDLEALLTEAKRRRIGSVVKLKPIHVAGIGILNWSYKDKRLQYIQTGTMRIPEMWIVNEAADVLSTGLKEICLKATK